MKLRNKKTEEIVDVYHIYISKRVEDDSLTSHENVIRSFDSIAELNEEWEDYEPAEPLIKDEKIRKAVRAWAEVNSIGNARYTEMPDRILCVLTDTDDNDYDIHFVGHIPTLEDGDDYTIAELCGEEEE